MHYGNQTEEFILLNRFINTQLISLENISDMSYEDVEKLCEEILRWKTFNGNMKHLQNWGNLARDQLLKSM
jgi:hypothetical protein